MKGTGSADLEETVIACTHCVDSPVPAVKSCLHCEVSLCEKHLRVHKKTPEHILINPTTSMEKRKCQVHKEPLKYLCVKDNTYICVSCSLVGDHRGHQLQTLDEAAEKKKEKLRKVLQNLTTEREETEKSIQQWERKNETLSIKIHRVAELNNMHVLDVLQQPDLGDLCDTDGGKVRHTGDPDLTLMAHKLRSILSPITGGVGGEAYVKEPADIFLDASTAHNDLQLSEDGTIVSESLNHKQNPQTPEKFKDFPQVLSRQSFSSGQHYWEVDVRGSQFWSVGMCYPSIPRKHSQSKIGYSDKSWCLQRTDKQCSVIHDCKHTELPTSISSNRIRIYLDYEAGQIFFFSLSDPIQHLHTFTGTFTDPLHAVLCVGLSGCIKITRGNRRCEMSA